MLDEAVELGRDIGTHQSQRWDRVVIVFVTEGEEGGVLEGWATGEEFVEDTAQGVQVCGAGDRGPLELFGGHVAGGTDGGVGTGEFGQVGVVDDQTHAEVQDLDQTTPGEHDVGGFEVAWTTSAA